ncbi:hypothetical protein TCE0_034f12193 [Talaromyces pinophilus]|uniref:Rhodopsin domain-containing protein n=1 Tax=Talaromyces pinophilus TaxID=128442 RepID=A0A6V8HMP9_TALPI|nr:hypothetical protein TCE0_034f12193 [Talaromyces pinophilus]
MGQVWNYANQLLYNPILSFVKVSVLLFLLRLESRSPVVRYMIFGTMYFTIVLGVSILIADIFQCTPVAYVYDTSIPGGHCIKQGAFYVSTATMTIFTDLLVVVIPMIIVYSLQMPLRRKLMVVGILCLGLVATGVGAWRLDQLIEAFFPTSVNMDYTYSIGFVSSAVEVNVAVISACCPALKSLIGRIAPRFLGTSGRGTYGKSSNTRYGHGTYIRSNVDPNDSYELGQKNYHNKQHTEISGGNSHGGRLPPRSKTAESLSLSDDDGIIAGAMGSIAIVKTTNVSVQRNRRDDHPEKASSVDSLV